MTDKFRSDYLMEADEYIPDEEKSQTPTEDQTDDEFGVDQYDGSEMTAEEAGVSDISEIYSIVSDFFPDEDEQKVKDWIESTMETENISTEAEFLDLYDDAESMENSYKSFGGDEDAVEAEKEATEPEEESETEEDEDETSEKSESESDEAEGDDEKEPVTESKKKVVKEAYSEDLSKELQMFMTIKKTTESDFVRKLASEAIDKIRAELKKPADQPKTPVTESVRDRIRAKLRANRK